MTIDVISDKILSYAKLGKLPSFVLAIVFWVFILLPEAIVEVLGLQEILQNNRPSLGIGAILFSAYYISILLYELSKGFIEGYQRKKYWRYVLRNLAEDEKNLLRKYFDHDSSTQHFSMSDGVAGNLEAKKILFRSSIVGSLGDIFPYSLQNYVRNYLLKHRELLES